MSFTGKAANCSRETRELVQTSTTKKGYRSKKQNLAVNSKLWKTAKFRFNVTVETDDGSYRRLREREPRKT